MNIICLSRQQLQYRFDSLIEYCILSMAFFLPLTLDAASVFLIMGITLWLGKIFVTRQIDLQWTHLDKFVLLLVILSAASILNSPDRGFSYYNYYHLMGRYVLIYYLVINNIRSLSQVKKLVGVILLSAIIVTGYGFYQYYHGVDISAFDWVDGEQFPGLKVRVFSTLQNPNLLAGFLITMIALASGLGLYAKRMHSRLLLAVVIGLFSICLVLTYSRGAWLSLFALIGVCAVFYNRKIFWLFLIVPLTLIFAHDAVFERIMSILNPTDTSSTLRMALWESTIAMIMDKPLLGIGWGVYWMVYPAYDFFIQNPETKIFHAHNMYLNIAAEIGIPGLLTFLAYAFGHAKMAVVTMLNSRDYWVKGMMLGVLAALAGIAINGLTDYVLFNIQLSMLFWMINALVVVMWQNTVRREDILRKK